MSSYKHPLALVVLFMLRSPLYLIQIVPEGILLELMTLTGLCLLHRGVASSQKEGTRPAALCRWSAILLLSVRQGRHLKSSLSQGSEALSHCPKQFTRLCVSVSALLNWDEIVMVNMANLTDLTHPRGKPLGNSVRTFADCVH